VVSLVIDIVSPKPTLGLTILVDLFQLDMPIQQTTCGAPAAEISLAARAIRP
jgi:hypothetical protein